MADNDNATPGGTIVISDDFIGIKDARGDVMIDDTAYFAHQGELDRQREFRELACRWFGMDQVQRFRRRIDGT